MNDAAVIASLVERCRRDHHAWINGDASGYAFAGEDVTIMGAFGGTGVGGPAITAGQRRAVAQFVSGSGDITLIHARVSGPIAWLVLEERALVRFSDRAEPQRWDLRVTEIFERVGREWRRVHRHADSLIDRHPLGALLPLLD